MYKNPKIHKKISSIEKTAEDKRTSNEICYKNISVLENEKAKENIFED